MNYLFLILKGPLAKFSSKRDANLFKVRNNGKEKKSVRFHQVSRAYHSRIGKKRSGNQKDTISGNSRLVLGV